MALVSLLNNVELIRQCSPDRALSDIQQSLEINKKKQQQRTQGPWNCPPSSLTHVQKSLQMLQNPYQVLHLLCTRCWALL